MTIQKKKYVWLAVAGVAAAALILVGSFVWPPATRKLVQGAIGHRDVYRQAQLTDKDVGVAGQVKFTVDDVQRLLQSPEFKTLTKDRQFQKAVADGSLNSISVKAGQDAWPGTAKEISYTFANPDTQKALATISSNLLAATVFARVMQATDSRLLARNGKLDQATYSGAVQNSLINAVSAQSQGLIGPGSPQ